MIHPEPPHTTDPNKIAPRSAEWWAACASFDDGPYAGCMDEEDEE